MHFNINSKKSTNSHVLEEKFTVLPRPVTHFIFSCIKSQNYEQETNKSILVPSNASSGLHLKVRKFDRKISWMTLQTISRDCWIELLDLVASLRGDTFNILEVMGLVPIQIKRVSDDIRTITNYFVNGIRCLETKQTVRLSRLKALNDVLIP